MAGLPAVGSIAPDFTLLDQDRENWELSKHLQRGDVVLCFYPFAFTGVCGTEMKCITSEMASWKAKGANVVGVSCDSMYANKAWAQQEGFKHTLLSDLHRTVVRAYGVLWEDLHVSKRATVVIGAAIDGRGRVKFAEAREPGKAMAWDDVLAKL
ncbi:MAG: redoxin domain-containing protein [Planctomycetota bacterium]|nr:redoxin domain-containing protein [Planctomycetota bacterium]